MKRFYLTLFLCISTLFFAQISKNIKVDPNKAVIKTARPEAKVATVALENINEWLCPNKLLRGDREFDGNGPVIKAEVRLRISPSKEEIWADITMNAKETKHDWSEGEGKWSKKVFEAPYGKKIKTILSDKASRTRFVSPKAGFQFLVPGADVAPVVNAFFDNEPISTSVFAAHGLRKDSKEALSRLITGKVLQGNTVVRVPATEGGLVKFFHIVGDTGGDDISNDDNCNDDTRIHKIEFFPIKVEYE